MMEMDVLMVLLLTLILHASVAYMSIIFVFKKKSGELRNYVEGPEMKSKLLNWFSGMLNEEIEFDGQKGKIIDLAGDVAVGKCLAFIETEKGKELIDGVGDIVVDKTLGFLESNEGKQMLSGVLDAAGAVVTQRIQEWLGGHLGQINKNIRGMGDEGIEAVAAGIHPLLGAAAATKAGKKFIREPLVQAALPIVSEYIQRRFGGGNGGNGSAQPVPSDGGRNSW